MSQRAHVFVTAPSLAVVLLGSVSLAGGCRQNDDPDEASAVLASVQADEYQSWDRAPGYETRTPAASPHSDQVEIFVNDVVAEALASQAGADTWPVGSIIVKDGYTNDGELELIALMEKREAGWFWAEYDATGEPLYSGSPSICTDCHGSGSDFVRAFVLP